MPYTPFEKNLAELAPEDLATLTDVYEGWYVEYKSELVNNRALAKSLSSFANQYGGWLFIGVAEDRNTHAAKNFPGIPDSQVQAGLESLRNASKDLLHPSVFYDTRVFKGPIPSVGLPTGQSIVVVYTPEGPIADSSDPKPETDRATLDSLFQRGEQKRSRLEERITRSPVVSKAEGDQPFIHISILSDPFEVMGHWYEGMFDDFSTAMKQPLLPFDNVFPTAEGYAARQVSNNDPYHRGFTWEFSRRCHSFITFPIPTLPSYLPETASPLYFPQAALPDAGSVWSVYSTGGRFLSEFLEARLEPARILDLNHLLVLSGAIIARHRKLVAHADVKGTLYIKARLENVWRATPFVDLPTYLDHVSSFGFPLVQDDDILVPSGRSIESFIHSIEPDDWQSESVTVSGGSEMFSIRDLLCVSVPIFTALGIPGEVLAESSNDLLRLHELRNKAQEVLSDINSP